MAAMTDWSFKQRAGLLGGLLAAGLLALAFVPPVPQDPAYHLFADIRSCLGIPNFGNVASNLAFLFVGLMGLFVVLGPGSGAIFQSPGDRWPYVVFFAGVALVCLGSAHYHAAPDNQSLFWDRLPMTVAFIAFSAGIVADRVERRVALTYLLPLLVLGGIASLDYWVLTEAAGAGDLRYYGFVQFFPIIALPLVIWLFPKAHYTGTRGLLSAIGLYGVAKVLEHFDAEIFAVLGGAISGHSLKHLTAAAAALMVLWMVCRAPRDAAA